MRVLRSWMLFLVAASLLGATCAAQADEGPILRASRPLQAARQAGLHWCKR